MAVVIPEGALPKVWPSVGYTRISAVHWEPRLLRPQVRLRGNATTTRGREVNAWQFVLAGMAVAVVVVGLFVFAVLWIADKIMRGTD